MGRFFKKKPVAGQPLSLRGLAEGLAKIDHALSGLTAENGSVVWSHNDIPTIRFGDDGAGNCPALIELIQQYGVPASMLYEPAKYVLCQDDDGNIGWVETCSHEGEHPEIDL